MAMLAAGALFAQQDMGVVTGVVTDKSGAAVPGAKILIVNPATNEKREAVTADSGAFTIGPLRIGQYNVSVERQGFKKATWTGINVSAQDRVRADFQLEIGALTESGFDLGLAGFSEEELAGLLASAEGLTDPDAVPEESLVELREFTPKFLEVLPEGTVVRISSTLSQLKTIMHNLDVPLISRAGSGVTYAYFSSPEEAILPGKGVIEFAPESKKTKLDLWPEPGTDFGMMKKVKNMFDPKNLLNVGRLYGRI